MNNDLADVGTRVLVLKEQAWPFLNNLFGAAVLIVVGYVVIRWLSGILPRALSHLSWMDDTMRPVVAKTVQYAATVFFVIAVLAEFGVETTSLIAALGAAGLAIGLALQGTLSNIAAGVMLLILRPLKVGEIVECAGLIGSVEEIGLFLTILKNADGLIISVPNSQVWGAAITNYSRNPHRRVNVLMSISYDDDVDAASALMLDLMKADGRVLSDPAPQVFVAALADSSVDLTLRCWTSGADYWDVLWDMTKNAKAALEEGGFTIPFPQVDMNIVEKSVLPAPATAKKAPRRRPAAPRKPQA